MCRARLLVKQLNIIRRTQRRLLLSHYQRHQQRLQLLLLRILDLRGMIKRDTTLSNRTR